MDKNCEAKRMGYDKETIKKKIVAFSVVAACLQFIKHNRKQQSFKHKKVETMGKTVTAHHGLVSELLLQDKEFRMLLRRNTETYEVSKYMLISMCATMWERRRDLTGPKSG